MHKEDLLIKQAASGDKKAFEKLIEQYKGYVFAILLNLIGDRHEAENVAQEVFLQVYISLPRYRFGGFRTWIGRIATNKAIDWKRKHWKAVQREALITAGSLPDNTYNCGPDEQLVKREEWEKLRNLCRSLPVKYGSVVQKYYFDGKSYREIAEEEGITVKTVESRLYRAKRLLMEKWEGG